MMMCVFKRCSGAHGRVGCVVSASARVEFSGISQHEQLRQQDNE